jgi:DNA mismatch repair protein MutL
VLFERMRRTLLDGKLERQAFLVPLWLELSASGAEGLSAELERLERAGFELEIGERGVRGGVRVGLRTVPALLAAREATDWAALLEESAAALRDADPVESRDGIDGALHEILASAACHAAVRKGDRLEPREVQALLESLDETIWFPSCPHGRPIVGRFDEAALERLFGRR